MPKNIRCWRYNDDGTSRTPCPSDRNCDFAHPNEESWSTAVRGRRERDFSTRTRDSGWDRRHRDSVDDRTSQRRPPPEYPREDSRMNTSQSERSQPTPGGSKPASPWGSNAKESRQSDGWGTSGWRSDVDGGRSTDGWGSGNDKDGGPGTGGWGTSGDGGWGSWEGSDGIGGWGSSGNAWGSTSSAPIWGNDNSAEPKTSNAQGDQRFTTGIGKGGHSAIALEPSKAATGPSDVNIDNTLSNRNGINTGALGNGWGSTESRADRSNDSKDTGINASTINDNYSMTVSLSPNVDQLPADLGIASDRMKEREVLDDQSLNAGVIPTLSKGKMRESSPSSTVTSFSKNRANDYRHLVREILNTVRLNAKLREAKHAYDRWKLIQNSKQLERARKKGCDKMNQIRVDLGRKVNDLEKELKICGKSLLKIPEISSDSTPNDNFIVETETLRRYAKEIESYLIDLERFRKAKRRADEEKAEIEKQRLASQPPPPIAPHIQTWNDLKARVKAIDESLYQLSDMLDEVRTFDVEENMELVEEERERNGIESSDPIVRIERGLERHRETLQTGRDDIVLLTRKLSELRLAELQAKIENNRRIKAELEERLAKSIEQGRRRREEIKLISVRVQNLWSREPPPFPYVKSLHPHLQNVVQEAMEEITPVLETIQNEHHIASLRLRQQAVAKINDKLFAILNETNSVRYHSKIAAEAHSVLSGTS